jgi:hypothetical protein
MTNNSMLLSNTNQQKAQDSKRFNYLNIHASINFGVSLKLNEATALHCPINPQLSGVILTTYAGTNL